MHYKLYDFTNSLFRQFEEHTGKDGVSFSINRSTLTFRNNDLEKAFKRAYFESNLLIGRVCHFLAILFYGLIGLWDGMVIEPSRLDGWLISISVVTIIFSAGFLFSYLSLKNYSRYWQQLYSLYVVATATGIAYAAIYSSTAYPDHNFIGIIFCLFFCYTVIRLSFIWASLAGNASVIIYVSAILVFIDFNDKIFYADLMYMSGFNLLGMTVNYALELISRRDFMLNELLKDAENTTKRLNASLEIKVKERTAELHQSNLDMQQSLAREKELVNRLEKDEEILQKSLSSLEQAEHIAKLGYFEKNWLEDKIYWSNGLYSLFGVPKDTPPFNFEKFLLLINKDCRKEMELYFNRALESRETIDIEFPINTADGRRLDIHFFAETSYNENGDPVFGKGIFRDITKQKEMEANLKKVERQLIQAQKMESVGRLAGGVAHDYNNMISIIIGYSELTLDALPDDSPLQEYLQEILTAAKRSSDITRQLLAFARQQTIAPKVVDLNQTMNGMLKMLQRLIGEDIDLRWRPEEQIWLTKIDPAQVNQILANLCVNARDAIEGTGKITIETHNAFIDESYCREHSYVIPGEYILLAVSDDGTGIPPENLEKIFEPFYTTKGLGEGTGLGLATVYGIVKQNEGFVNVYSEPKLGTTFKVYFPKYVGAPDLVPEEIRQELVQGRGETLLIVEDDESILRLTAKVLENSGYTVLQAGTPGAALNIAEKYQKRIDLLITDVIMPEMNGRYLSDRLTAQSPHLRTLFMSGYTANVIAHHGVLDGDVQFIHKPFTKKDLTAKVREVLEAPVTQE